MNNRELVNELIDNQIEDIPELPSDYGVIS